MKNTLTGLAAAALLLPAAAFALFDCGAVGCTEAQLMGVANQTSQSTENRVQALQMLVQKLLATIAALKPSTPAASTCFVPTHDLIIGSTDATTNGDVTKLQQFLLNNGYGDLDGDSGFLLQKATGYYGQMTAASVVKWQKAHGMDFVTPNHGVGPMTRRKMQEKCGMNSSTTKKVAWIIEKANPSITDDTDYRKYEQAISADITVNGSTKRYGVGKALGCEDSKRTMLQDGTPILGHVNCYYAATGVGFTAYDRNGKIVIERHDDDASGRTSGTTTIILEI